MTSHSLFIVDLGSGSASGASFELAIRVSHSLFCSLLPIHILNLLIDLPFLGLPPPFLSEEHRLLLPALLSIDRANHPLQVLLVALAHHFHLNVIRNLRHLVDPYQRLLVVSIIIVSTMRLVAMSMVAMAYLKVSGLVGQLH